MSFVLQKCVALVLLQLASFAALGWCELAPQPAAVEGESLESGPNERSDLCLPEKSAEPYPAGECAQSDTVMVERTPAGDHDSTAPEGERPVEPYVSRRIHAIREAIENPFSFASHKANYLLPVTYRELPAETGSTAEDRYGITGLDPLEVQFQFSLQLPVWSGFLGEDSFLSLAYTNSSFWQAYTGSGIFRETNHEPELLATWMSDWQLLGFQNVATQVGISHQSNGRGGSYSRGWNRIYANFIFERGSYFIAFKPWYRLSKERDVGRGPDLDFHFGNFELTGGYRAGGYSTSIMLRNNLRSENRGALELSWGFPITDRVRGFVKYFDGYGESLIDYSTRVRTLGVGLELAPGL